MNPDEERRALALSHALDLNRHRQLADPTAEQIVADATAFETYLKGTAA